MHDQLCLTKNFDRKILTENFNWSNRGIIVEITGVDCSVQQSSYQSNNVSESKHFQLTEPEPEHVQLTEPEHFNLPSPFQANVDVAHYCEGVALPNSISTAHFYYKFTFSTAEAGQRTQTARSSSIRRRGLDRGALASLSSSSSIRGWRESQRPQKEAAAGDLPKSRTGGCGREEASRG